jgi:hypothetical protein
VVRHIRSRWALIALVACQLAAGLLVGGCGVGQPRATATATASGAATNNDVIDFTGVRGIHFGDSRAQMIQAGLLNSPTNACALALTATASAHPIFDQDKLVLIWAYPPLHTPEGIMVGSPLAAVTNDYPQAVTLTPAAGNPTFPAYLVANASGAAYLFLHDATTVQKLIVGYEDYVRLLYSSGFGSC